MTDPLTELQEDTDMADNRPINRPLDPDDDLLTDDQMEIAGTEGNSDDADASTDDDKVEATDNSGETLAEADDVSQAPDAVADDDADDDDGE